MKSVAGRLSCSPSGWVLTGDERGAAVGRLLDLATTRTTATDTAAERARGVALGRPHDPKNVRKAIMPVLERPEAVTLRGKPFTLLGRALAPGEAAPPFTLVGAGLAPVSLSDSTGTVRLLSCVPSLDTPVCSLETKRWEERRAELGDFTLLTVSMDLPFAQSRWAAANGVTHTLLSGHLSRTFGIDYGVLIKELRLLDRAIFVIDRDDTIRHIEYVREVSSEPDYEQAVAAIKALA